MKWLAMMTLLLATSASAHHGWSEYHGDRPLKVTGTIVESGYIHPHGFVRLKADDKTWLVVLAPPSRLKNRGLSPEMLSKGASASVLGYQNRNDPDEMRAERITIGGKATELR